MHTHMRAEVVSNSSRRSPSPLSHSPIYSDGSPPPPPTTTVLSSTSTPIPQSINCTYQKHSPSHQTNLRPAPAPPLALATPPHSSARYIPTRQPPTRFCNSYYPQMTRESSLDYSHGLALTTSNSSSLRSYNSSIAESTATHRSVGSKIKRALSRKRSKSVISMSSSDSQVTQAQAVGAMTPSTSIFTPTVGPSAKNLIRNKSIPSLITSLHSLAQPPSHSSTRDNSISSLSDYDSDIISTPLTPLHRIEEDSVEKTGVFPNQQPHNVLQSIRYNPPKRSSSVSDKTHVEICDKVLDDMADNILDQVSHKESIIEWRI